MMDRSRFVRSLLLLWLPLALLFAAMD